MGRAGDAPGLAMCARESSSLYSRICSSLCNICKICASSSNFFSAAPPSECGRWPEGAVWWVALPGLAMRTRESSSLL